jgi:hypothetical protein
MNAVHDPLALGNVIGPGERSLGGRLQQAMSGRKSVGVSLDFTSVEDFDYEVRSEQLMSASALLRFGPTAYAYCQAAYTHSLAW